jgi:type VI secretion system protein ImpA
MYVFDRVFINKITHHGETVGYIELLKDIEGESTTGIYLKSDRSTYRSLRNTFNAAQSSFRRLIETPDSSADEKLFDENQQNWLAVNNACWQTLTEKSKDVEVYCWWVMSLAFQDKAMVKISESLHCLVDFIEKFWPDIQPFLPSEKLRSSDPEEQKKERVELQLRPLIQLLGESTNSGLLFMPLQMMSLVAHIDHAHYFSANKNNTLAKLKVDAQQHFSDSRAETTETIQALDLAITSLDRLDAWLKESTTSSTNIISVSFLKTNLIDNLQAIKFLVSDCYDVWPLNKVENISLLDVSFSDSETEVQKNVLSVEKNQIIDTKEVEGKSTPPSSEDTSSESLNANLIIDRNHAFQELRKISNYFAKQEPHSPVSFLLEKAIRWGYMSLPELMSELVEGNDNVLKQINLVAGLRDEKSDIVEYETKVIVPEKAIVVEQKSNIETVNPELEKISKVKEAKGSAEKKTDTEFNW